MSNKLGDQLKETQLQALATVLEGKIFFVDSNANPGREITALFQKPGSEPVSYIQMDINYIIRDDGCTVFASKVAGRDVQLLFQGIMDGKYSYYREVKAGDERYGWIMAMYQNYRATEEMIGTKWWPRQDEENHTWEKDRIKTGDIPPQSTV